MYIFSGFKNKKNIKNNENKKQLTFCISINFCSFFFGYNICFILNNKMMKKTTFIVQMTWNMFFFLLAEDQCSSGEANMDA